MPEIGEIKRGDEIGHQLKIKYIWKACIECGKQRWVELRKTPRCDQLRCRVCGIKKAILIQKERPMEYQSNWKGGKCFHNGYWRILLSKNDFFRPMSDSHGYVREHRLVMAKHLKRCLLPWEVVHHKNGNKGDNRIENLELLPHGRFHIADTVMMQYVQRLEKRVTLLEAELTLLRGQLESMEQIDNALRMSGQRQPPSRYTRKQ